MEDRCIGCGAIIPEGRLSCYICEANAKKPEDEENINFSRENISVKKILERYHSWIKTKRRM